MTLGIDLLEMLPPPPGQVMLGAIIIPFDIFEDAICGVRISMEVNEAPDVEPTIWITCLCSTPHSISMSLSTHIPSELGISLQMGRYKYGVDGIPDLRSYSNYDDLLDLIRTSVAGYFNQS